MYQKIIARGILLSLGALGLFAYHLTNGTSLVVAQTIAFATLVAGQLVQTFSWRQEGAKKGAQDWLKDKYFVYGLCMSWLALGLVIYIKQIGRASCRERVEI